MDDKTNKTKIRICIVIWLAVAATVIIALFLTKSESCLWGLVIPAWVTSDAELINFSVKVSNNNDDDDEGEDNDDTEAEIS